MSFSIESIYNLLGASLSSTSETQRKLAEEHLLSFETQPGYSSLLLVIIAMSIKETFNLGTHFEQIFRQHGALSSFFTIEERC
jgi:hypothetical protein